MGKKKQARGSKMDSVDKYRAIHLAREKSWKSHIYLHFSLRYSMTKAIQFHLRFFKNIIHRQFLTLSATTTTARSEDLLPRATRRGEERWQKKKKT